MIFSSLSTDSLSKLCLSSGNIPEGRIITNSDDILSVWKKTKAFRKSSLSLGLGKRNTMSTPFRHGQSVVRLNAQRNVSKIWFHFQTKRFLPHRTPKLGYSINSSAKQIDCLSIIKGQMVIVLQVTLLRALQTILSKKIKQMCITIFVYNLFSILLTVESFVRQTRENV